MNQLCLLSHIDQLHKIGRPLVGDFIIDDPTTTEPWATLLTEVSAGRTAFDAPLFLAQGLEDQLVVPGDTTEFAAHEASPGIAAIEVVTSRRWRRRRRGTGRAGRAGRCGIEQPHNDVRGAAASLVRSSEPPTP